MIVYFSRRSFPAPTGCRSVLKKRAAAWFTMRSWGLGVHPNKRPMAIIGHRDIACDYYRNVQIIIVIGTQILSELFSKGLIKQGESRKKFR